jgi:ketosteroid isomerase-like protein
MARPEDLECSAVRAWFEAFNRHDLDGMLSLMAEDVRIEPIRVLLGHYHGHEGVRRMFLDLERRLGRPPGELTITEIRKLHRGSVLMVGRTPDRTVFAALHDFNDRGQIAAVRHYLTDEETLTYIGRLDPDGGEIDPH